MKSLRFISALLLAGLAGCVTLNRTDRSLLLEHHVPPSLFATMSHGEPLSLSDVIELTQLQLSPRFIVHYLGSTGAVYRLGSQDVLRLSRAKVSPEVIDYLLATPSMYAPQIAYPYQPYRYGPYPFDDGFGPVVVVAPFHRHWR